jgi:hypothetical protein
LFSTLKRRQSDGGETVSYYNYDDRDPRYLTGQRHLHDHESAPQRNHYNEKE